MKLENIRVVHILRFGVALCGRPGLPYQWPVDHAWISYVSVPDAEERRRMCPKCVAAKRAAQEGTGAEK